MSTREPVHTGEHALEIFYSYAHADKVLRDELEKHLSVLKRQKIISNWHDRLIDPGANRENEIDNHLTSADIILLLVSSDFLDSDYCYSVEMHKAMERHRLGEAKVVPIILRPTDWQYAPFGSLQALPTDGNSVTEWNNLDRAFLDIVTSLRKIIDVVQYEYQTAPTQPLPIIIKPNVGVIDIPPPPDHWQRAGAIGNVIRSFVASKEWGRAESTARMIEERDIRSEVLRNLAIELAENQQWQRAEAIAHTIDEAKAKEDALIKIVDQLTKAKLWMHAESVARTIEHEATRSLILQKLSYDSLRAGEYQRALGLANTFPMHSMMVRPYIQRSSIKLLYPILVAVVVLAIVVFFPQILQWLRALLAFPNILLWGIITLLFIIGVIFAILRWLRNR